MTLIDFWYKEFTSIVTAITVAPTQSGSSIVVGLARSIYILGNALTNQNHVFTYRYTVNVLCDSKCFCDSKVTHMIAIFHNRAKVAINTLYTTSRIVCMVVSP